eukprot:1160540-Pelagomonas_calceolata.AAC.2
MDRDDGRGEKSVTHMVMTHVHLSFRNQDACLLGTRFLGLKPQELEETFLVTCASVVQRWAQMAICLLLGAHMACTFKLVLFPCPNHFSAPAHVQNKTGE